MSIMITILKFNITDIFPFPSFPFHSYGRLDMQLYHHRPTLIKFTSAAPRSDKPFRFLEPCANLKASTLTKQQNAKNTNRITPAIEITIQ
jgi:hypothetical protein